MACSKCSKRRTAEAAEARAAMAPDLLEPRWLVKVDDYEGEFTAVDGMRYPLGSGAFYPILNSDVKALLSTGNAVSFPNEEIAEEFKAYNGLN